jgi:hypothetical protein
LSTLPRNRSLVLWRKNYINSEVRKYERTICDVIRELHRRAVERGDMVDQQMLETANEMANRMQDRLKVYSIRRKYKDSTLCVDEVGVMYWLAKEEYKRNEKRKHKRHKAQTRVQPK